MSTVQKRPHPNPPIFSWGKHLQNFLRLFTKYTIPFHIESVSQSYKVAANRNTLHLKLFVFLHSIVSIYTIGIISTSGKLLVQFLSKNAVIDPKVFSLLLCDLLYSALFILSHSIAFTYGSSLNVVLQSINSCYLWKQNGKYKIRNYLF